MGRRLTFLAIGCFTLASVSLGATYQIPHYLYGSLGAYSQFNASDPAAKQEAFESHRQRCEGWKEKAKEETGGTVLFADCGARDDESVYLTRFVADPTDPWGSSIPKYDVAGVLSTSRGVLLLEGIDERLIDTLNQAVSGESFRFQTGDLRGMQTAYRRALESYTEACDAWKENVRKSALGSRLVYVSCAAEPGSFFTHNVHSYFQLQTTGTIYFRVEKPIERLQWKTMSRSGAAGVFNPVSGRVEWRTASYSGVAGVFNPKAERVEWKIVSHAGVAGVYNPAMERVEWETQSYGGVAGVLNPDTGRVEWKKASYAGVAGVYNPATKRIEWKTASYSGVAGVYNPTTQRVEWKIASRSGVAGVFNAGTGRVEWKTYSYGGVAGVSTHISAPTLSSSGGTSGVEWEH